MKSLFVVIVLLLVGSVALGVYQGWFLVSSDKTDHNSNVTITVDQDKFKKDQEKAKETVQDLGHKAKENTVNRTDKVKDQEPRP